MHVLLARLPCAAILLGRAAQRPPTLPFGSAALRADCPGARSLNLRAGIIGPRRRVPRRAQQQLRRVCLLLRVRRHDSLFALRRPRGQGAGAPRRALQSGGDASSRAVLEVYETFGELADVVSAAAGLRIMRHAWERAS